MRQSVCAIPGAKEHPPEANDGRVSFNHQPLLQQHGRSNHRNDDHDCSYEQPVFPDSPSPRRPIFLLLLIVDQRAHLNRKLRFCIYAAPRRCDVLIQSRFRNPHELTDLLDRPCFFLIQLNRQGTFLGIQRFWTSPLRPRARAARNPAWVLSRIRFRSNSASAPNR